LPLWDNGTPTALRAVPFGFPVRFRAGAVRFYFEKHRIIVVYKQQYITANIDIYNYKNRFERTLSNIEKLDISDEDKKLLDKDS